MNKSDYPNLDFICSTGNFNPGTKFNPKALTEEFEELLNNLRVFQNVIQDTNKTLAFLREKLYDTECVVTDLKDELRALRASTQAPDHYDIHNFYPM